MVSRLDRDVGRILDTLAALGLAENTVVFFTSDNGPHRAGGNDPDFFNSNGPLRGIKRDLYEGGIRVPMIAWGPGRVPAGEVSNQVWAMWDVLPTAAALTGAGLPPGVDGISMAEAVTGGVQPYEHAYLYWEFYEGGSAQAVRVGRWKAVRQPMLTGRIELYDLDDRRRRGARRRRPAPRRRGEGGAGHGAGAHALARVAAAAVGGRTSWTSPPAPGTNAPAT